MTRIQIFNLTQVFIKFPEPNLILKYKKSLFYRFTFTTLLLFK